MCQRDGWKRELRPCGTFIITSTQKSHFYTCLLVPTAAALPLRPPEWVDTAVGQVQAMTRCLADCTESSCVITGRCWGGRLQPGGSTRARRAGRRPAGCYRPPWWTGSFWSPCSRLHASPAWTRSSRPGPVGAAGSSPWGSDVRIVFGLWMQMWEDAKCPKWCKKKKCPESPCQAFTISV